MLRLTLVFACLLSLVSVADARLAKKPTGSLSTQARAQVPAEARASLPAFGLVAVARFYLGQNPTGMAHVWCGRFMRLALRRAGYGDPGPAFDAAFSFRSLGRPALAQPGAIVVWSRGGRSGHVGVIVQVTAPGRAVVISGNDGPAGGRSVMERERSIAGASFRAL